MTARINPTMQRLIAEIERKDRRFRAAQVVFLSLITIGFVGSAWFLYSSLRVSQAKTEQAIGQQTDYIRCLAKVFAQPPNDTVTIKDLDRCKLNRQTAPAAASKPSAAIPIAQPKRYSPLAVKAPTSAAPIAQPAKPTSSGGGTSQPPVTQPDPHPAVSVLGIPVCVPLTDVCARQ